MTLSYNHLPNKLTNFYVHKMVNHKIELKVGVAASAGVEKKIKRGESSWVFFYAALSIFLIPTTFIIEVIPTHWIIKIVLFVLSFSILFHLCIVNAWFQNKLIGWKSQIENTFKKI